MKLVLIRGLPGSGKSTLASLFGAYFEADQFFVATGFDPSKLGEAHEWCQQNVREALCNGYGNVAVSNTFTQRWEMQPYIEMAEEFGATLVVLSLFDGGLSDEELFARNIHGVPLKSIKAMRRRFQHDWRTAPKSREKSLDEIKKDIDNRVRCPSGTCERC